MNKSDWISVKDRLPEESPAAWVLVYADGAMNCMAFSGGEWRDWTNASAHNIVIGEITHWMPLPDDPEIIDESKTTSQTG